MSCTFQFPQAPKHLLQALHEVIPQCELLAQQLPETSISLWLIPPAEPQKRIAFVSEFEPLAHVLGLH
jgi:hypothetical protein